MALALFIIGYAACGAAPAAACRGCKPGAAPVCAPVPATRCVTEMVPYTVMKTRTRMTYEPVECTIMVKEPITQVQERQRVVCRPIYETTYVQRTMRVCRPVYDTQMVAQEVCVRRPVQVARQVACVTYEPYTQCVSVPVASQSRCGLGKLCGKLHGRGCAGLTTAGCTTIVQTCYRPVATERTVYETQWVTETQTRQVPVTTCRMVTEDVVRNVPITNCRMEQRVITERRTVVCGYRCVPKQITKMRPVPVCETVPVTCYRPVTRVVPACPPPVATAQLATPQGAPNAQASAQGH
jgi:hypothetical protein